MSRAKTMEHISLNLPAVQRLRSQLADHAQGIGKLPGQRELLELLDELGVPVPYQSQDANVEANRQMLLDRSNVGFEKYGTTTERTDLELVDWLQHAIEEALDLANYLQAAKRRILLDRASNAEPK